MSSPSSTRKRAVVIGAGPGGLMAAERLASAGWAVDVYDRMPSMARKFLMAGRGGLNLTHSEPLETFLSRYGAGRERLEPAIRAFPPEAVIAWAEDLGVETFVGSSGRVFPKAMKASPLLRAWAKWLGDLGVQFQSRMRWLGWDAAGGLSFNGPDGLVAVPAADATVLALGGASWPRLGSDGAWVEILRARGIAVTGLTPSNCGYAVEWSDIFRQKFAGEPLKRLAVRLAGTPDGSAVKGEAVITEEGIEGGAIYALGSAIRSRLATGPARLTLDLKPGMSAEQLAAALAKSRKGDSLSNRLRKAAGLPAVAIGLLREAHGRELTADPALLAAAIKAVPVTVTAARPIERAISSAGGVSFDEVDEAFELKKCPGTHVVGEMLDWDAPTGGYLLQATFSSAVAAAAAAVAKG
ncbi:MAG: TIGR03862 family flavoprotein [Ancalomicrobiaceae bacterium]|nr:TIGR03862 family flavoprotein [Ancalomicrobiaceae bacterium]